jgi:probable HAF family extracellular repeat protein
MAPKPYLQHIPFIWENGVMRDIGTLGGLDAFPATSCSGQPHNVVVGMSSINSTPNPTTLLPTVHNFIWIDGKMTDLGNLGGTLTGFTGCANHRDQVIGEATLPGDLMLHAFFWADGVITDLGTLGGDNSEAICCHSLIIASLPLAPNNRQFKQFQFSIHTAYKCAGK